MYLCPGKAIFNRNDQKWYITDKHTRVACDSDPDGCCNVYCEACFKEKTEQINNVIFYFEYGGKRYCHTNKKFSSSCAIINDVRVSIVDAKTLYRFNIINEIKYENYVVFGLPNQTNYCIVLENYDTINSKINIKSVFHDNVSNIVYSELGDNIIINSMSHSNDLIFNGTHETYINIKLEKWRKHNSEICYILDDNPIEINIKLVCNNQEKDIIKNIMDYYSYLTVNKKKIVIINDYLA